MTIVLQYQFFGLEVDAERFAVTLSFGGVHERLEIPLAAITAFADPSVNFALQFQANAAEMMMEEPASAPPDTDSAPEKPPADGATRTGQVVALDAFRKK
jgi:uncharacterized protein